MIGGWRQAFSPNMMQLLPAPVFFKDRYGRFLLANQVVTESMGETSASLRGKREAVILIRHGRG